MPIFRKSILIAAAAVSACNMLNDRPNSYDAEVTDFSPNYVSMSLAVDVANNFAQDKGIVIPTRGDAVLVKNTFTVRDADDSPILHAINFEGGGFTLVSSDNRLMPVLAYSNHGEFSFSDYSSPLGLRIWVETVKNMIEEANSKGEELDPGIAAMWQKLSSEPLGRLRTRSLTPEGWPPPEADTLVGPFINDSWHQDTPYNDSLKIATHFDYSSGISGLYKPVVGCLPLAIARVMRYHQYPSSFSWSFMPDTTPQTTVTASFIAAVHYLVKSYSQGHYSFLYEIINGSRLTTVDRLFPVGAFLQSQYGYASGEDLDFAAEYYEAMRRDMIDYEHPCILYGYDANHGSAHFWICDGYSYSCVYLNTPSDPDEEQEYLISTYLHHRWGLPNASYDGWFWATNYTLSGLNLHYQMRLARRISPIDYWPEE